MPSASANISAKFIAQIEISKPCVRIARSPADARSPRIVKRRGRPAAASEPNASTRIASVTGHEMTSDFIIALRFAVLKSLHIPEAPVSETLTPEAPAAASFDLSVSAAATIAVGSPFAPAVTRAVWPSAEMLEPARGFRTEATFVSARRMLSTRAMVCRKAGAEEVSFGECTTTINAELERPAKLAWMSARACTDSDPFACQPAPESAVSTFGANAPSTIATIVQERATMRTWSAVKRPSRPSGPTASGCSIAGAAERGRAATVTGRLRQRAR